MFRWIDVRFVPALLAYLVSFSCAGQWNSNPAIADARLCTANTNELQKILIPDGQGGAIAIFEGNVVNVRVQIYAQRIDTSGILMWDSAPVPRPITTVNSTKWLLDAVPDGAGGAYIAWLDDRDITRNIYVQRINAMGHVLWQPNGIPVNADNLNERSLARLVADSAAGLYVVWDESFYDTNSQLYTFYQVFAQRFTPAGEPRWGSGGLRVCTTTPEAMRGLPSAASGAQHSVLIAFSDGRNGTQNTGGDFTNLDVFAQRLDSNGQRLWGNGGAAVCTSDSNQILADEGLKTRQLMTDGTGGAYVVFNDYAAAGNDQFNQLTVQRINAAGALYWQPSGVGVRNVPGSGASLLKLITDTVSSSATLMWADGRHQDTGAIYVQRLLPTGAEVWTTNGVRVTPPAEGTTLPYLSDAVSDTAKNLIAVWTYENQLQRQVVAQKITNSGEKEWIESGVAVCTNPPALASEPIIVAAGGNSSIISWSDKRSFAQSRTDLYAARLLAQGVLAGSAPLLYITIANGDWHIPGTWQQGMVPPTGAKILVRHSVNIGSNVQCSAITVESPGGAVQVGIGIVVTLTPE
jgi:hypothetical protein